MTNEQGHLACPIPTPPTQSEDELIRRLVKSKRIAVVGISDRPDRPSYYVSEYMQQHGAEILPVNPTLENQTILGHRVYGSLKDVPGEIDLVDVFRRPQFCPDVVRDAIAAGAKAVWLQAGIRSPEAEQLAKQAGLAFIQDRCLMVEHSRRGRA
jgi:predicted CoA-binding protein